MGRHFPRKLLAAGTNRAQVTPATQTQGRDYYTGSLGFHYLFIYGEPPFYAYIARDDAITAIRHVTGPVINHDAGEALLSAFTNAHGGPTDPAPRPPTRA